MRPTNSAHCARVMSFDVAMNAAPLPAPARTRAGGDGHRGLRRHGAPLEGDRRMLRRAAPEACHTRSWPRAGRRGRSRERRAQRLAAVRPPKRLSRIGLPARGPGFSNGAIGIAS
jgi:hypothetical protein